MPVRGGGNCGGAAWWTPARVVEGLRRLHRETGQAPTSRRRYQALVGPVDRGRAGALRRYPSAYSVSRHYEGFAQAWRAAGVAATSPTGMAPVSGVEGLSRARAGRAGERHGRLVLVRLSGSRWRGGARRALWLCRCDCGGERLVDTGRLGDTSECEACSLETRFANLRPFVGRGRPRRIRLPAGGADVDT